MSDNNIVDRNEKQKIVFIKNGVTVESRTVEAGSKLYEKDFPKIPVEKGKKIIWCYHYKDKGFRQMVMTPFTVPAYVEGMAPIEQVMLEAFEIVDAEIAFAGAQSIEAKPTGADFSDGTVNIRFFSVIHSMQASAVGMEITADFDGEKKRFQKESRKVCSAIRESSDGESRAVKAFELGGTYLYALTVAGVPVDKRIEFTVCPYVKTDMKITSRADPAKVIVINGIVQHEL